MTIFKVGSDQDGVPTTVTRNSAEDWIYQGPRGGITRLNTSERWLAEAVYHTFTAPAREGCAIGFPDGVRFMALPPGPDGAPRWSVCSPTEGPALVELQPHEAKYLTDVAVALGTDTILANAVQLELMLREARVLALRRDEEISTLREQVR